MEKTTYENYVGLADPEEQVKCVPKEANYSSGEETKRKCGESTWNNEGKKIYE